ncbi:hypothetical protein FHW84_002695 [Dyella sp. SG562]|uniref:hypothetical protein n=1 Tax=Dyella sp. SG562 TaxID=2587017 RepID=UPI001422D07B|nr:hypothetical protein [Dyella sp. SG562]NII74110.1 hypothetical protein [Dyella sp. SG562]
MLKLRLPAMIATCTLGAISLHAGAQSPPVPHPHAISADLAPLASRPALVELSEVYALLTPASKAMTRSLLARRSIDSFHAMPPSHGPLDVALIDARALEDDKVLNETGALFDAGLPVAVFIPEETSADARGKVATLFGAASEAGLAVYARKAGGGVRVFSTDVDRSLAYADTAERVRHFQQAVADHLAAIERGGKQPEPDFRQIRQAPGNGSNPDHLPIVEFTDTTFGSGGQSLTREITVIRDSTASKDQFNVIMKTSGLIKGGADVAPQCRPVACIGYTQYYLVDAMLDYGRNAQPTVARTLPETTSLTDLTYNHTESETTSFGFNLGADAEKALAGNPAAAIKPSFGFNFGKSYTKSTSITFTVKDYSTAVESRHEEPNYYPCNGCARPPGVRNTWKYQISQEILNRFRDDRTMTPAMRQFAPQSYSSWTFKVSGGKHPIKLAASSSVVQRNGLGRSSGPVVRVKTSAVTIDLDSPYLHREPVVILQSKENAGRCLINDGRGAATLGTCSRDVTRRAGQWYLDSFDRYVSRLDGRCLAVNERNARQVEVVACNDRSAQKWYWAADRINSKLNGGDSGWRLFVDGNAVKARIDPKRQQVIPNNPNQVLLNPWSTYPKAPVAGATIPTLGTPQPQVPEAWVRTFRDIPSTERWEPVALRQYKEG